jgi:hypothetical protein
LASSTLFPTKTDDKLTFLATSRPHMEKASDLFSQPPVIEPVDVLAAKLHEPPPSFND